MGKLPSHLTFCIQNSIVCYSLRRVKASNFAQIHSSWYSRVMMNRRQKQWKTEIPEGHAAKDTTSTSWGPPSLRSSYDIDMCTGLPSVIRSASGPMDLHSPSLLYLRTTTISAITSSLNVPSLSFLAQLTVCHSAERRASSPPRTELPYQTAADAAAYPQGPPQQVLQEGNVLPRLVYGLTSLRIESNDVCMYILTCSKYRLYLKSARAQRALRLSSCATRYQRGRSLRRRSSCRGCRWR
jgi:hypothetical protein